MTGSAVVGVSRAFAVAFVLLGAAILVRTVAGGGGQVGILAGIVFVLLGVVRWRAAAGRRPRAS